MTRPISLQLYTVREQSAADFRGVLERVAQVGYAAVEPAGLYGMTPADFKSLVGDLGMRVSSAHIQGRVDGDDLDQVADEAAATGAPYMVIPFLPPDKFQDAEAVRRLAERLGRAADAAETRGMKLAYHNHNFEFVDAGGRTGFDVFVEAVDPRVVFELDIYWAQTGGVDPATLVGRLGSRVPLLHVKDGPCTQNDDMVAVGDGEVDIPGVLSANDAVEWHIVELDRYAGDMWEAVERSYAYLTSEGLSKGTK